MQIKADLRITTFNPAEDSTKGFDALLTTEHSQSSYGIPALVVNGVAYGPADIQGDDYEVHIYGDDNGVSAYTPGYKALADSARRAGYKLSDSTISWSNPDNF